MKHHLKPFDISQIILSDALTFQSSPNTEFAYVSRSQLMRRKGESHKLTPVTVTIYAEKTIGIKMNEIDLEGY